MFIFCFVACVSFAQKFSRLQADFSILEKNTEKDSSYIVTGNIDYNLFTDVTKYEIAFPEKSVWVFQDSTLNRYDSSMCLVSIDTVGQFNEFAIFQKILTDQLQDFGLEDYGFRISEVEKIDSSIIYQWSPPNGQLEFLKNVVTQQIDEKLVSLIFIDENDLAINKTYYEDYIEVKGLPIPQQIKTHFATKTNEIFRILEFRSIQVN